MYRVYLRQLEDAELIIGSMTADMQMWVVNMKKKSNEFLDVSWGDTEDYNWPIQVEQVKDFEAHDYLISEFNNHKCLIIRSLSIVIKYGNTYKATDLCDELIVDVGNVFAVMRVVRETVTNIQAV